MWAVMWLDGWLFGWLGDWMDGCCMRAEPSVSGQVCYLVHDYFLLKFRLNWLLGGMTFLAYTETHSDQDNQVNRVKAPWVGWLNNDFITSLEENRKLFRYCAL